MPSLHEMMTAIEKYQSVLNKDDIDGSIKITGVANLSAATKHQVAFLAKAKYLDELNQTNAGVVLLSEQFINEARTINPKCLYVLVKDAYLAYACVSTLFTPSCVTGIHRTAIVADSAVIGNQVSIGANAVIGEKVVLADGVVVGAGVIPKSVQAVKLMLLPLFIMIVSLASKHAFIAMQTLDQKGLVLLLWQRKMDDSGSVLHNWGE